MNKEYLVHAMSVAEKNLVNEKGQRGMAGLKGNMKTTSANKIARYNSGEQNSFSDHTRHLPLN